MPEVLESIERLAEMVEDGDPKGAEILRRFADRLIAIAGGRRREVKSKPRSFNKLHF